MRQFISDISRRLTQHSVLGTQHLLAFCIALSATGCMTATIAPPSRIALLAPFEGRYREVGYNALYAARLALQDTGPTSIELLPIDDGGTATSTADRARALARDPQVQIVLATGFAATSPDTMAALDDLPVIVIGNWDAQPTGEHVFVLSNPAIDDLLTIPAIIAITDAARLDPSILIVGSDVLALDQLGALRSPLAGITVVTSATLPDPDFAKRYTGSDPFAPAPGLLASLTYDATRIATEAIHAGESRAAISQTLSGIVYSGLNGEIAFENGSWRNAPIHTYRYDKSGALLAVDRVIE